MFLQINTDLASSELSVPDPEQVYQVIHEELHQLCRINHDSQVTRTNVSTNMFLKVPPNA